MTVKDSFDRSFLLLVVEVFRRRNPDSHDNTMFLNEFHHRIH